MNDRIREPFHSLMWKASIGYNDSWSQVDPEVLEKFAELIVQECMRMCDVAEHSYITHGLDVPSQGCRTAKEYIADWFEVKE